VRELVMQQNLLQVIAGDGQIGNSGNGAAATSAQMSGPTGIAVDGADNVYIADNGNNVVRVVNGSGTINSLAGTLNVSGTGTTANANTILFHTPTALTAAGNGTLKVLDAANSRIVTLTRTVASYTFSVENVGDTSPGTQFEQTNTGSLALTIPSPIFTQSGAANQFTVTGSSTNGCTAGASFALAAACYFTATFSPTATGTPTGNFSETATATSNVLLTAAPVSIALTGTGSTTAVKTTVTTAMTTPATGNPPYGTAFVVTATIHPASCSVSATNCAITGTVTFYVDGIQVGTPVTVSSTTTSGQATGTAAGTISGESEGNHKVVAIYNGDTNYEASTASSLPVTVAGAFTTTVLVALPSSTVAQFSQLNLQATVSSTVVSGYPTGTVTFYATQGTTTVTLGSVGLLNGVATLTDTTPPDTLGLYAGTYAVSAVYNGDQNFSTSTSNTVTVTVTADQPTVSLIFGTDPGTGVPVYGPSTSIGTAQGSSATTTLYVTPTNTVSGALSFTCKGLPLYTVCTFLPQTLTFTPVQGTPTTQSTVVAIFTDVAPYVIPPNQTMNRMGRTQTVLAAIFGWPLLLVSLGAMLATRRRLHAARLLLALCAMIGGTLALNGCGSNSGHNGTSSGYLSPVGTYTVTLQVSGPNISTTSAIINLTIGPGIPGQE